MGRLHVAEILIENGANIYIKNTKEKSGKDFVSPNQWNKFEKLYESI